MKQATPDLDGFKKAAALKAVDYVRTGMIVGLGTGSTAKHVIVALGERVKKGLKVKGVPTSQETAMLARKAKIPLLPDDEIWPIDVAIDGADQVDPQLNLIKGGGGALLKEKIVASAAQRFIVVVDHTKRVPVLGGSFPLPVEIIPFGWANTARTIEALGGKAVLRTRAGKIFRTDAGHYIVDVHLTRIDDPASLEAALNRIPGVVENGLFVARTSLLIVGTQSGVEEQHAGR
jgi:ribose 5-phosphate isomerase A